MRSTQTLAGFALCVFASCASSGSSRATYQTPDSASAALAAALRSQDPARIAEVIGSDGVGVLASGDEVADRADRDTFLAAYDIRHDTIAEGDEAVIVVGPDAWPLPVPLVHDSYGWHFDVERGKDEIISRRIGRNELDAIEVCRAIADAENDYSADDHGQGKGAYAQRFLSSDGQKDGLYWSTAEGEPESPLGPLIVAAAAEGYRKTEAHSDLSNGTSTHQPYHGYFYRILTSQGPSAPGGASDYVVGSRMTGGFALIAEPATYGNSGVMSFLVGPNGVVYQRDLGEKTEEVAAAIASFDPTPEWVIVKD